MNDDINKAVDILRTGGLVAFPTETVYGLGADASNEAALRKIFKAKRRPYDHPLIVHIANLDQVANWAIAVSEDALKLARAFWPGPLTMILKKQPGVLDVITGGQDTIGIRIPSHPIALALLQTYGGGIAAPSANKFTHISPTAADAVREELGDEVDLILNGGACEVGLESTIIDMSQGKPVILRPGMITAGEIEMVLGKSIASGHQDTPITRAPGMHHLHYAPKTKAQLIATADITPLLHNVQPDELPMVFVIRSDISFPPHDHIHWVKMPQTAVAYAHELYRTLRLLDNQHYKCMRIEMVPEGAEWEAIRDRLTKATAAK